MSGFPFIIPLAQAAPPDELYDIVVLAPEKPIWPLLLFIALACLLVGGLVWMGFYLLRSRRQPVRRETAVGVALRRLRELEQSHGDLEPNCFSLAVSETLKDFLSATFGDPVRFETTQEFLSRVSWQGTKLPSAAQQSLKDFLVAAEEVKFGNAPDASEKTLPLLQRANELVTLCRTISSESSEKARRKS